MKLVKGKTGLILRLGVLVTAMLFGQQAMAEGTRANTAVDNTALVDYEVAGVPQVQLNASSNFVVDRRVDFVVTLTDVNLTPVTPGGPPVATPPYFVEFTVTNTSNSVLDFFLDLNQMIGGTIGAGPAVDDSQLDAIDLAMGTSGANGDAPPVRGVGNTFIDELEADDFIRVRVYGDPGVLMTNGQIAGVQLDVSGREGGAPGLGAILTEDPNTALGVENVFDNPAGGNLEVVQDGFLVVSAALTVAKVANVIAGDLGSGLAIPGATVEYVITLTNASPDAAATVVSLSDLISPEVTLILDDYDTGALSQDVQLVDGGGTTECSADANDVDGDGCGIFAPDDTLIVDGNGALGVAVSDALVVSFQVLIPDPATTP
jgi:uncharacterized repeat protein (TIGR01451 family)